MSIHAVDARVKTLTETGIVSEDVLVWPGPEFSLYYDPDNGALVPKAVFLTTGGITVTLSRHPNVGGDFIGDFEIREQYTSWEGNFTEGDTVLWNQTFTVDLGNRPGQIIMAFSSAVKGVGCQIQQSSVGTLWHAHLRAYDAGNNLLFTAMKDGHSCSSFGDPPSCPENSAIFIGVAGDAADAAVIKKVDVNVFLSNPSELDITSTTEDMVFGINFLTFGPFDPLAVVSASLVVPPRSVAPLLTM